MRKRSVWLQTKKQWNWGTALCDIGFLLFLLARALAWNAAAAILSVIFCPLSIYVFLSVLTARRRDRESVSYSLLWGTASTVILMCLCVTVVVKG